MQIAHAAEGLRQKQEVGVYQLVASPKQAHGDEKTAVGKKRTTEPGHSDTIRHREDNCQERTAALTNGGSRYPLKIP